MFINIYIMSIGSISISSSSSCGHAPSNANQTFASGQPVACTKTARRPRYDAETATLEDEKGQIVLQEKDREPWLWLLLAGYPEFCQDDGNALITNSSGNAVR